MSHQGISSTRVTLTSQTGPLDRWQRWLLPTLLIVQAIFVGSTFRTLGMTASVTFLVLGVVYAFYLSTTQNDSNQAEANADAAGLNKPAGQPQRGSQSHSEKQASKPGSRLELLQKFGELKTLRTGAIITIWLVVIVAVVAGATLRVGHHLAGNVNPIAMLVDSLAHSMLWMSLVLWFFFPRRGHPAMLGCGIILVMATVTGGGVSRSITGQLSAALATLIAFAYASRQILGVWQNEGVLRQIRRRAIAQFAANPFRNRDQKWEPMPMSTVSVPREKSRSSVMFGILALSILLTTASAIGQLASTVMPGMQSSLFSRLSESLESVTGGGILGGSRYVRGSKLGSVKRHMLGDPSEIALRAYASNEPGYLRGTVFDTYDTTGRWFSAASYQRRLFRRSQDLSSIQNRRVDPIGEASTPLRGKAIGQRERVPVHPDAASPIVGTIEVRNVEYKGQIAFTSLSTDWLEASIYDVQMTHHDVIKAGINYAQPYVLGVGTENPVEELSPLRRNIMLGIPKAIAGKVKSITEAICEGKLTPQAKAKAIEDHFQENFQYSLSDPGPQPNRDPVVNFLESQHPAHCEFFASAAAIMLRSVGVPTRYVTGYVVREMGDDDDDYWLARNRDAHAWVEAYDENQQQWFPVEATTGRAYRTLMDQQVTSAGDATIADGFEDDDEQETFFGKVAGWILSFRTSDSLTFIFQVAQLPLLCLLVILLWVRHRQRQREGTDSIDLKSRKMLARVDRKVRKHSLVRSPFETIHQFASRVEDAAGEHPENRADETTNFLMQVAQWYRSFAASRYRGQMPEPPPEAVLS